MEESQIVRHWQELAREMERVRTLRDFLLRAFRHRMPAPPPEVVAAVQRQDDAAALERLLDLALEPGTTVEQMRAALGA